MVPRGAGILVLEESFGFGANAKNAIAERGTDFIMILLNAGTQDGDKVFAACAVIEQCGDDAIEDTADGAFPAGMGCADKMGNGVGEEDWGTIGGFDGEAQSRAGGNQSVGGESCCAARDCFEGEGCIAVILFGDDEVIAGEIERSGDAAMIFESGDGPLILASGDIAGSAGHESATGKEPVLNAIEGSKRGSNDHKR